MHSAKVNDNEKTYPDKLGGKKELMMNKQTILASWRNLKTTLTLIMELDIVLQYSWYELISKYSWIQKNSQNIPIQARIEEKQRIDINLHVYSVKINDQCRSRVKGKDEV